MKLFISGITFSIYFKSCLNILCPHTYPVPSKKSKKSLIEVEWNVSPLLFIPPISAIPWLLASISRSKKVMDFISYIYLHFYSKNISINPQWSFTNILKYITLFSIKQSIEITYKVLNASFTVWAIKLLRCLKNSK